MIYRGDEQPLHPEVNPRAAFDRLFASALSAGDADAVARVRSEKRAILDLVNTDLNRLRTRVGAEEMRKVEAHAEALRSIELRLDSGALAPTCAPPAAPAAIGMTRGANGIELTLGARGMRASRNP